MVWHDLLVAVALMLVLEGIMPFLNPAGIRRMLRMIIEMDDAALRVAGLSSMVVGLIMLYVIK
ncbi:MAG TPA: DUF2065 domain-containing protein [Gammaproteobacteria bacterium]|nr:DUF2065 domain-containing protein [Gammaproteobacteria bacterium]